jgi:hypothetical protein
MDCRNYSLSSNDSLSLGSQSGYWFCNSFHRLDHGRGPEDSRGTGIDRLTKLPFQNL